MRYEAQFPAVRSSALQARRFVSGAIAGVPGEIFETVELIASELAANSVRHAASAFEVRIEQFPDRIHLEVDDDGDGEPVVKSPGPMETSGRGLQIVTALADEWGVIPKRDGPGKTVWVTIAVHTHDGSRPHVGHVEAEHPGPKRRASGAPGSAPTVMPVGRSGGGRTAGPRLSTRSRQRGPRPRTTRPPVRP